VDRARSSARRSARELGVRALAGLRCADVRAHPTQCIERGIDRRCRDRPDFPPTPRPRRFERCYSRGAREPRGRRCRRAVTNPAYGDRLETNDAAWRRLGDLLKQKYAGWRCAVIAGEPSFGKHIGLKAQRRIATRNGPLDARILVFDLYRGSRANAGRRAPVRSSAFPRNAGGSEP
jgi:hypothetical protein